MTTAPVDPRSITDAERPYLDDLTDLGQMADLRRRIIEGGESPATANGVCGWLLAKKVGDPDVSDSTVRARYRRILRDLQSQDAPKGGRSRRSSAEAGSSGLPSTVGIAAGALVGAVASTFAGPAALVGLPVALYVTEIMGGWSRGAGRR